MALEAVDFGAGEDMAALTEMLWTILRNPLAFGIFLGMAGDAVGERVFLGANALMNG